MAMKRYIYYILVALCSLTLAACGGDDDAPITPGGGDNPGGGVVETPVAANLDVNSYALAGEVAEFGSVKAMMVGDNLSIVATPQAGIASAEEILECGEFIYAAVNPLLIGKEFDLMTEQSLYTFISTMVGAELESVAPDLTDEIEAGTALFTYQNSVLNVKADLTLVGGVTLSFHAETTIEVVINENVISSIYGEKPLRAAFYLEEDGVTYLYFTPAGISYFEELSIATWYLYLVADSSLLNGEQVDITAIDEDTPFIFGMVDNLDDSNSFEVASVNIQSASGMFNIKRNGEGDYTAIIDITYGGAAFNVAFTGECVSANVQMPVEQNYVVYEGEKLNLIGASLTKAESVWRVELDVDNGTTIVATAPATFFDGNARGFSQSADLTVSYEGVTYSKANGYSGTFTALYDESGETLSLLFTNYDNLEFSYAGSVTINE